MNPVVHSAPAGLMRRLRRMSFALSLLSTNGCERAQADPIMAAPADWSQGDWVVQTLNGQLVPAVIDGQTFTQLRIVNIGAMHQLTVHYMFFDAIGRKTEVDCDGPAAMETRADTLYTAIGGIFLNEACTFRMQRVSDGLATLRWVRYNAVLKRQ